MSYTYKFRISTVSSMEEIFKRYSHLKIFKKFYPLKSVISAQIRYLIKNICKKICIKRDKKTMLKSTFKKKERKTLGVHWEVSNIYINIICF